MFCVSYFALAFSFVNFGRPYGTYKSLVSVPMLPKQEVLLTIKNNTNALISLKGTVNIDEEFLYEKNGSEWNIIFGEKMKKFLSKLRCNIKNIVFDPKTDVANVMLNIPIVGQIKVVLKK